MNNETPIELQIKNILGARIGIHTSKTIDEILSILNYSKKYVMFVGLKGFGTGTAEDLPPTVNTIHFFEDRYAFTAFGFCIKKGASRADVYNGLSAAYDVIHERIKENIKCPAN
jgi:hypothetical protein